MANAEEKVKGMLDGKVVVVTGAAQGIGAVTARRLAQLGARVSLCDLNEEAGARQVEALRQEGLDADFHFLDLMSDAHIHETMARIATTCGGIDGIVNNARPFISFAPFPDCLVDWDKAMTVMAKAPAVMVAAARPYMAKTGGSVVNVSSTNALFISQQPITYHAAKAALTQVTNWLAAELGPEGIRVNAVLPGLVDRDDRAKRLSDDPVYRTIIEATVPLRRAGKPEDTADTIAFLLGDGSRYITGQSLVVDGGLGNMDQFECSRAVLRALAAGRDA